VAVGARFDTLIPFWLGEPLIHPEFGAIYRAGLRAAVEGRVFGKVEVHTNATDGLIGEFRIANTPLGDETLELADEGVLDASAGFNLKPDGATWHERRTLRKLHKVWLVHVAMTPDPAYEDARVLAVRAADTTAAVTPAAAVVPTPHLAELYARELAERAAAIDARYSAR